MDRTTAQVELYFSDSITVRADKNNMFDSDTAQLRARVCLVSTDDIINPIMAKLRAKKTI